MAAWTQIPEDNPLLLPDGARIRVAVEGERHTLHIAPNPFLPQGVASAHIDLDMRTAVWEYWSDTAPEQASDFVAGYEAAAAEGGAAVVRENLRMVVSGLVLAATTAAILAVCHMASPSWWTLLPAAAAMWLFPLLAQRDLRKFDKEARRG